MRYVPENDYYWESPTSGARVARHWEFGPTVLDDDSAPTGIERLWVRMLRALLRPDAYRLRTQHQRMVMTAVRRYEQARVVTAAGAAAREVALVAVADTGLTVSAFSTGGQVQGPPLTDAQIVTVTVDDQGRRFGAITLVPRTVQLAAAQSVYVVDHPDDATPMCTWS